MVVLTLLPLVGESELVKLFRIDWTHYLTRRSEKVIHSFCHLDWESLMNTTIIAFLYLLLCFAFTAHADTFGSGSTVFDIEFVDIGNPGNPDDTKGNPNPVGKVDYVYRIG